MKGGTGASGDYTHAHHAHLRHRALPQFTEYAQLTTRFALGKVTLRSTRWRGDPLCVQETTVVVGRVILALLLGVDLADANRLHWLVSLWWFSFPGSISVVGSSWVPRCRRGCVGQHLHFVLDILPFRTTSVAWSTVNTQRTHGTQSRITTRVGARTVRAVDWCPRWPTGSGIDTCADRAHPFRVRARMRIAIGAGTLVAPHGQPLATKEPPTCQNAFSMACMVLRRGECGASPPGVPVVPRVVPRVVRNP